MTSVNDVAAAIRRELRFVRPAKLYQLLYYCQGHHLAHFGERLFDEPIVMAEGGLVVHVDDRNAPVAALDTNQLNTIGWVCSHYGRLSARELDLLTRGGEPWRRAQMDQAPGASSTALDTTAIEGYFRAAEATDRAEDPISVDDPQVRAMLAGAVRPDTTNMSDDMPGLLARLQEESAKRAGTRAR